MTRFARVLPWAAVLIVGGLLAATALNLTVLSGTVDENRATIRDLCGAVVPTQAIYRFVLTFPPDPRSPATPRQQEAFRGKLREGIRAVDALHCPAP